MLNLNDNGRGGMWVRMLSRSARKSKILETRAQARSGGSRFEEYLDPVSKVQRRVDMDDWTRAVNQAQNTERPSRVALLNLYDSLLKDSHLASVCESRTLRILRSKMQLLDAKGKKQDQLLPLFEVQWFDHFLRYAMEAHYLGHTLIELGELEEVGKLRTVYRMDARHVLPGPGLLVKKLGDEQGINFREGAHAAYMVEVGRPEDLGLLAEVAPPVITKKYAMGSWSDYTEKFGIPSRWVTTDTTDQKRYNQLGTVMRDMLSRGWAVLQGAEKIEMAPVPGTDAHKTFDELISRSNSEISKRILGQDGTSDNKDASGTYGSLQVLQKVAEDRHLADKTRIQYLINDQLFPRLINLGYPLKGIRFAWDEFSELEPTALIDGVAKLSQLYEVDPKYITARTGIPILGFRRMPGEGFGGGQPPKKDGATPPEDEPGPAGRTRIHGFRRYLEPRAERTGRCPGCGSEVRAEATPPPFGGQALEEALRLIYDERAEWSQAYFDHASNLLRTGLLESFGAGQQNLSYSQPDHVARTLMEANIFEFSAAKTLALTNELNQRVTESKGYGDFKKRSDEVLDEYDKVKLRTEYDMAVQTGLQASRYYEMKRSKTALPYWEYITAGDDQVRQAHADLAGKVFKADDGIWANIYPPNGWRCRCSVLPRYDLPPEGLEQRSAEELLGDEQVKDMKANGFYLNRADLGMVFQRNNTYVQQLNEREGTNFRFGIKDSYPKRDVRIATLAKGERPAAPDAMTHTSALQWHKERKDAAGNVVVTDYAGRPIVINEKDFERKLDKGRAQYLKGMQHTLASPDEVWFQGSTRGSFSFAYFKFYDTYTLKVVMHLDKATGHLGVASWVPTTDDSERQGVLIKPLNGQ